MNFLIFLNSQAGELEKILSGTKSMLVKEYNPSPAASQSVSPGDSLYLLRNKEDFAVRVKASVVCVRMFSKSRGEEISQILKEMQPRLQLTEDQYNYWTEQQQLLLIEFEKARKIDLIYVASNKISAGSGWIAFEELSLIS